MAELKEKSEQLEAATAEIANLNSTKEQLEAENADLSARLQKTDNDLSELQAKLVKLEAGFDELKRFGDDAAARYSAISATADTFRNEVDQLSQKKSSWKMKSLRLKNCSKQPWSN